MTILDIFLILTLICLVTLVAFLAPTLMQIKQSARRVEDLIGSLNQDLPPLIRSLAHTSKEIQLLSESLKDKADRSDKVIETAKDAADALLLTSNMMKNSIAPIYTQISGFSAGVQAFLRYIAHPDKRR